MTTIPPPAGSAAGATTEPAAARAGWVRRWAGSRLTWPVRQVIAFWQRSIAFRVVSATLTLSIVVTALLGTFMLNYVAGELLRTKVDASEADASAGIAFAQSFFQGRDAGSELGSEELTGLVQDLANQGGPNSQSDVVLMSGDPESSVATRSVRTSRGVLPESVPASLREHVAARNTMARTFTLIEYTDRPSTPGLAIGSRLTVPEGPALELYYLFPLSQQQDTLNVVRRAVAIAGVVLVLLLGAVAWLVVRQVVTPVRMAARIAERISAGRLEERMSVRGKDDLARLASSFNQMARSLQQQIRQLEHLSRVQRRFVSDVSHELRTPVTTVRMAADVLHEARDHFDPGVRRSSELLQNQLERFESLLGDLLEISRFDAGAAVLDLDAVDLRDVARRSVDDALPLAQRTGSPLRLDLPKAPCFAEVDIRRIQRIARNLVENALEHGDGKEVVIRVATDDDAVALTVRDHGVGLRPGESSLVFNRFWRADPSRARTTGGTGLGLSIALEDARLHHGWLQAWGEPGLGSQFRLTVPCRAGEELADSPLPLIPEDAVRPQVEGTGVAVG